jgi:predicted transposase/invertase (TIGR01784 family)
MPVAGETSAERWERLTIANDFIFCKVMLDVDICREVLETILGVPIERVEHVGRQEVLDASPDMHAVRLDVYARDEAGTVYDVEMQSADTYELPRRARYYQSLMALDQLQRGEPYRDFKDAYAVFLCAFDPFGRGRRVYWFENTCRGDADLTLDDGANTLFLAATAPRRGSAGNRLDELLDYVADGTVAGELSQRLDRAVASVRGNEKWRLEYMHLEVRDQLNIERGREEGRAQGREEGRAEGREEGEARLSALIDSLLAQGRTDDVRRVVGDPAFREELYRSFDLV